MTLQLKTIALAGALLLPFALLGNASALSVTCTGTPATSSITWNSNVSGGVSPFAYLWGNGVASSSQTVVTGAGTHSMTLQVTDASTTVATTSCSATVAAPTSTSTPSSVVAQIQALLAQIEGLKKQIAQIILNQIPGAGGSATSTPSGCFGFWRDLKHGDDGDDVKELQKWLAHNDPSLFPPGLVNGHFGPKTFAALKMLQRRFGIDIAGTGFFGMKSRGHLAAQCSKGDKDGDGLKNFEDPDDDNDGVNDAEDRFPFNPKATSTPVRNKHKADDDDHDRSGKGHKGDRDDDDDDEDEDDD